MSKRTRVIVELLPEIAMAIRLRAVKNDMRTGDVVTLAVEKLFPDEIAEAKGAIAKLKHKKAPNGAST